METINFHSNFKDENPSKMTNCSPVSIINNFSNILEQELKIRIIEFFNSPSGKAVNVVEQFLNLIKVFEYHTTNCQTITFRNLWFSSYTQMEKEISSELFETFFLIRNLGRNLEFSTDNTTFIFTGRDWEVAKHTA